MSHIQCRRDSDHFYDKQKCFSVMVTTGINEKPEKRKKTLSKWRFCDTIIVGSNMINKYVHDEKIIFPKMPENCKVGMVFALSLSLS